MTHKKEWDQFIRQAAGRAKSSTVLADHLATSKVEMFNMWMDSGKDWSQTTMTLERKNSLKNQSVKGYEAIQGKELRKRFVDNPEKYDRLISQRKTTGMFYPDEDFPNDDDDSWHLISNPSFENLVLWCFLF